MGGDIRVGTSGWQYDDWRGRFYPAGLGKGRWFVHYAGHFPTVEVNASFYRLPALTATRRWEEQAPARFRYAAKGSRYVTHNLKLANAGAAVGRVMERFTPMTRSLAVVLWQLPPHLHRDDDRLAGFLALLPGWCRHAVEFRHRSWLHPAVFELLDRHGAAHVWLSSADMPVDRTLTGGLCYLRFHGLGEARYRYDYSRGELAPWVEAVRAAAAAGADAYVFFNNDFQAHAPANAATFVELLGEDALPWP